MVPRPEDDPIDSMVTIIGPAEACKECERRLLGSATSSLQRGDAERSASTTAAELDAKVGDTGKEIWVHVVSAVTGEEICAFGADKCWRGVQLKVAIQQATRIPCIQHKLLLDGCVMGDHKVLDTVVVDDSPDIQVMFIRLNPTRKLYWKISLSDALSELHSLAMSKATVGYFQRPFFHVRLLQYDTGGRCITSDVMADDEFSLLESAIEQLSGDIIDVKVTAVAVLDSAILGRVDLPKHVRCTNKQEMIVVLADHERKINCSCGDCVAQRDCLKSWPRPDWVGLCPPVIVQGHIELKAMWPAEEVPQFFDPSRAPSAANMEERMNRGNNRGSFSAKILDGMFVSVKQHSSMGAAIILFKVQQHRDLLISRYSNDPLVFRGTRIDLKAHKEKQPDGTLMEIPVCAFAGWKRQRNGIKSAHRMFGFGMYGMYDGEGLVDTEEYMIVHLFDYLCSCC